MGFRQIFYILQHHGPLVRYYPVFCINQAIMSSRLLLFIFFMCAGISALAQASMSVSYVGNSDLRDHGGDKVGEGGMTLTRLSATYPVVMKKDSLKRMTFWGVGIEGAYAALHNSHGAQRYNPGQILDAALRVIHLRPLKGKWSLLATLGVGVYCEPSRIMWDCVLASGGAGVSYKFSEELSAGFGAGLTNSYGIPMVLPMAYFSWKRKGKFEFDINFLGHLKADVATYLAPKVKLSLTAIEMGAVSAVVESEGKKKFYSAQLITSGLKINYEPLPRLNLYFSAGVAYGRTTRLCDRKIKEMFRSFFNSDDKKKFAPSPIISIGASYGI